MKINNKSISIAFVIILAATVIISLAGILLMSRQIIESHHGTLTCDSRPGDGCTFTIALPLTQN